MCCCHAHACTHHSGWRSAGGPGYGYGYAPPPGASYARRGRRARARDLEEYLEDLEDELARVRQELDDLREPGPETGSGS